VVTDIDRSELKKLIAAEVRSQVAPLFDAVRDMEKLMDLMNQKIDDTRELAASLARVFVDPEEEPTRQ
jgi:hypothetical protein